MASIKNYLSLVKFSHTIFAMPFAFIGFFLAVTSSSLVFVQGNLNNSIGWATNNQLFHPELIKKLVLVILCMITARSAAMAFNRWLDKHFDAKNPRTAIREIPAGIISANHALIFVVINCIAFIILTWLINKPCFYLSPVALFVVLFYSYTKRFTSLCHFVLGLGLSLAPVGAYLAVTGKFDVLPVIFSFVVLFWVSGFDIIYALQDIEFDQSENLYSIPVLLGKKKALRLSEFLHLLSAILLIIAGLVAPFGMAYWVGTAIFCGMLIYQHSIIQPDDLRRVNIAFMTANGIASVVFAVLVIADLFIRR